MRRLKFAFRTLFRSPFVTIVAVLSLGLGIGANSAIFSLFNQMLMRPLPVQAPAELVNFTGPGPKNGSVSSNQTGNSDAVFSYPMFRDLEREQQSFTGIAGHRLFGANVGFKGQTLAEEGSEVSGSYFGVLGLTPAAGRLLAPSDDATVGEKHVVVLTYGYWESRFSTSQAILGDTLVVNGQPMSIVGVAPRGFEGTTRGSRPKVFVPITLRAEMEPPFDGYARRDNYWVYLFARLKPNVTIAQARTTLGPTFSALINGADFQGQQSMSPDAAQKFKAKQIVLEGGRRGQSSLFVGASQPITVLMCVTGVVLLIACANIANLLLARGAGRAGEMAVRLSIGASRGQLVRQLLLESCLLALLGGAAGILFMQWTIGLVTLQLPPQATNSVTNEVSAAVLLFTGALSIVTGLLFGLFPALHSSRPDLALVLKGQAGQPSGAKSAARFRRALIVVQIALSMGLLASAGLFTKSLLNVSRVDLGVKIDHLITFSVSPRRNGYTVERANALFERVEERLATVPGVVSASAGRVPIIAGSSSGTSVGVDGYTGTTKDANYNEIGTNYFRTTGMTILAGRDFSLADTMSAPKVAIVNEAFARQFDLGHNPVGRRMRQNGGNTAPFDIEIVGLVQDAKYNQVRAAVPAVFFIPYRQVTRPQSMTFYGRTAAEPEKLLAQMAPLVAEMDPNLPVQNLRTMEQQVAANVANDRVMSVLSATFAAVATLLAAIGLYGVLAYTVSQRTREFGLRLALGADPSNVRQLVLRQVFWMTLIGGVLGLGIAITVGRLAKSLLFEMQSDDPVVMATSIAVLTFVSLAAGFLPAHRASRVDPMTALRYE